MSYSTASSSSTSQLTLYACVAIPLDMLLASQDRTSLLSTLQLYIKDAQQPQEQRETTEELASVQSVLSPGCRVISISSHNPALFR